MEIQNKNRLIGTFSLFMSLIICLGSTFYTGMFFDTMAIGNMRIISVGIGVVIDSAKFLAPAAAVIQYMRNKLISSIVLLIVTIIAMTISFFASQTYDLNHNNKILNETTTENHEYSRKDDKYQAIKKSITTMQNELDKMIIDKDKLVNESVAVLQEQYNQMPDDYLTRKNNKLKEINKMKEVKNIEIKERIAVLESKIEKNLNKLDKTEDSFGKVDKNVRTTKGIYALAVALNKKNPDIMLQKILTIKNAVVELFAVIFPIMTAIFLGKDTIRVASNLITKVKDKINKRKEDEIEQEDNEIYRPILEKKENNKEEVTAKLENNIEKKEIGKVGKIGFETKKEIKEEKKENKIGFEIKKNNDFNDGDLRKYLETFYDKKNWKGGYGPGYTKISSISGLNKTTCSKIRGMLDQVGLLETEIKGNIIKSKPVLDLITCIRKLQKLN